jgi:hypothetical protein
LKQKRISKLLFLCVLFLVSDLASADPTAVFNKLKGLVGKWQGTFEWSGARTGSGDVFVSYSLTGNGSTVVENFSYGKGPMMTSMYYMDLGTLRMTHFCGVGNQPRLKAVSFDKDEQNIQFEMTDITNLKDPQGPHVNGVKFAFEGENKISVTFVFTNAGKESLEEIHLKRV